MSLSEFVLNEVASDESCFSGNKHSHFFIRALAKELASNHKEFYQCQVAGDVHQALYNRAVQ